MTPHRYIASLVFALTLLLPTFSVAQEQGLSAVEVNGFPLSLSPTLQWAGDGTLLLVLSTGSTLLPPGPDDATPIASPAG